MFVKKLSICALASAALLAGVASAFTKPAFPRIGGIQIGSPMNFNDATYQANLARQNVMILGMYPGLAPGGQSINSIVQAIKAKNPNALVFLYANLDSLQSSVAATDSYSALRSKITAMKWWLYSDKSLTKLVPTPANNTFDEINITQFTPTDSQGNTAADWITRYLVSTYYTANPAIDGLFMDNTNVAPPVAGDWQRNGTVRAATDPQAIAWFQQGYARYYSLARSLMPGKYMMGNITEWAASGAAVPTTYKGMVDGGVLEGFIGKSWSTESWAGWQVMMTQYGTLMGAMNQPKIGIFNQWGDPTDYQSLRYGLASCLMNDAYFSFTNNATAYSGVSWFDEYDNNLGQAQASPTAAWQSGVWRRDFDNGIALVNPKGNGTKTVTLETAYVKIKGTQDPAINSGQTVTTVTLKDRDGIILLRKSPVKRPDAPQKLTTSN